MEVFQRDYYAGDKFEVNLVSRSVPNKNWEQLLINSAAIIVYNFILNYEVRLVRSA